MTTKQHKCKKCFEKKMAAERDKQAKVADGKKECQANVSTTISNLKQKSEELGKAIAVVTTFKKDETFNTLELALMRIVVRLDCIQPTDNKALENKKWETKQHVGKLMDLLQSKLDQNQGTELTRQLKDIDTVKEAKEDARPTTTETQEKVTADYSEPPSRGQEVQQEVPESSQSISQEPEVIRGSLKESIEIDQSVDQVGVDQVDDVVQEEEEEPTEE